MLPNAPTNGNIPRTIGMTTGGVVQTPHKWAVGTTFEWEFDFPITTNPAYEAKPAPKRKTRTSANPKAVSSRARKTSKSATVQTAKPKAS